MFAAGSSGRASGPMRTLNRAVAAHINALGRLTPWSCITPIHHGCTHLPRPIIDRAGRASRNDEPAVHTGAAEFGDELLTLTYSDVASAVDRLAAYYADLGLQPKCAAGEVPPERVIAVLTSTAIDESLLEMALAKLGLTSLLLSVNNSVAAVAHLCKLTKSSHLVYGPKYANTAAEARKMLADDGITLETVADKRFPIWGPGGVRDSKIPTYPARLTPEQETKRTCVILHSSGSTGFPKPVYVTHYGLIANAAVSVPKTGFSALPLFHGFGHFSIFRCLYHGKAFTLMPPHLPITSANIVRTIKSSPTPPVQHFAVPYVLKLLGETEEGTASLASMEAVSFAGAAVPDDLGDRLVAAGVPLYSQYGTTETGALLTSRREYADDKAWNWLRVEGLIAQYLELIPQGSNSFEVVVKDGWPGKVMSNRDDGAYCTKDLVVQHPDHPTWVKYVGRLDDTLTQTLGEKTNPVPIELAIRGNSPLIQECIVFGDARPQTGALILPSDAGAELSKDRKAYMDAIWPVIADANSQAPTHSRLLPEMIEILPVGTEIPVATKMSILRPACYKKFGSIISDIYERFEQGNGAAKQEITSKPEMEAFLTSTIITALGEKTSADLSPSTDLFAYGVDSLQATRVRNVIQKSLELGDAKLGQNIVYEHPSISQLSDYLLALNSGATVQSAADKAHATMVSLVDKWAAQIDVTAASSASDERSSSGEVVVLTGATGSLGAHILDQLTRRPEVSQVICLSRAKDDADSLERVRQSLALRKRTVPMGKVVSYAADVNRPDLGLSPSVYDSIQSSATAIIHNAWPVNFVLSINSFDEHIGGVVNLINMGLKSSFKQKPAFFFSSSVGTRQGRPEPLISETFPDSPTTAGGMGYGQSKWVVEKIMQRAGQVVPSARFGVLRIGQLVGDTESGVWNETEAWPLMFRSANEVGALPLLDEKLQWFPVDQAAQAISDLVLVPNAAAGSSVYHVLNPKEASWGDILEGLRRGGLKFDAVDRLEWLARLAKSNPDVTANPTYKLLTFYQNRIGKDEERAHMDFAVTETAKLSPTVAACRPVDADLVALWTKSWKESGFVH